MKIQRGDTVVVVAGNEASKTPRRVASVLPGGRKLVVEGVNSVLKHVKRGHPRSPQGGRLELDMPIDASNVMLFCGSCSKGVRVGYRYRNDGAKERFCKSCGTTLGQISHARKSYAKS